MYPHQPGSGLPPGVPPQAVQLLRIPAESILAAGFDHLRYPKRYLTLTAHHGDLDSRLAVLLAAAEQLTRAGFELVQILEASNNGLYAVLKRGRGA